MEKITIHTTLTSEYFAYDLSGQLSSSVVFGITHDSNDTDPRSLVINTANSLLDVHYGLAHGLLSLRIWNPRTKTDVEVDVSQLSNDDSKDGSYVALPTPIGRKGRWHRHLTVYKCEIDPNGQLALLFEPGREYRIRINKGCDFGGKGFTYTYTNQEQPLGEQEQSSPSSELPKLVTNSKGGGVATFRVVPSLHWPPKIEVRMHVIQEKTMSDGNNDGSTSPMLEIIASNTGTEAISIQITGRQQFLEPRSPKPQEDAEFGWFGKPPRSTILATRPATDWTIQVIDMATSIMVRDTRQPSFCCVLYGPGYDPRTKLNYLLTLNPNEPVARRVKVSEMKELAGLPDGVYGLRMKAHKVWWCVGRCEDFVAAGEEGVVGYEDSACGVGVWGCCRGEGREWGCDVMEFLMFIAFLFLSPHSHSFHDDILSWTGSYQFIWHPHSL